MSGRSTRVALGIVILAVAWTALAAAAPSGVCTERGEVRPWLGDGRLAGYLQRGWEASGRPWLRTYTGLMWAGEMAGWQSDPGWGQEEGEIGPLAYYVEHAARGGIEFARASGNVALLDELARFYLHYAAVRLVTLGELRRRGSLLVSTALLDEQGPDATRTMPWREKGVVRDRLRECLMCNAQFFHPASRLISSIAGLEESRRTEAMREFVRAYVPLVAREHVLRLGFEIRPQYPDLKPPLRGVVAAWRQMVRRAGRPRSLRADGMRATDLWLMGTAAELLGARAADPGLVDLRDGEVARLRELLQVGTELLAESRTVYQETRDFLGRRVESASYFNGDFDAHPDLAFAGAEGAEFPLRERPAVGASWDISHAYRIPVALRSLFDNRSASGLSFPGEHDLDLTINQFVYRVFEGDWTRPLFRNFLDGQDGWYRVGYHGSRFGYPPSRYCDMGDPNRPCLTVAGVYGWGLLAFVHQDLLRVQCALIELAARRDRGAAEFRDRYYRYNSEPFAFGGADGGPNHSMLLFVVVADASRSLLAP